MRIIVCIFFKDESNIYNRAGKWIIKGTRTLDTTMKFQT